MCFLRLTHLEFIGSQLCPYHQWMIVVNCKVLSGQWVIRVNLREICGTSLTDLLTVVYLWGSNKLNL